MGGATGKPTGSVASETPHRARRLWWAVEPINAVARFAPEAIESAARLGLHDPTAGHLITRLSVLAPLAPRVRLAAAGWHVGPTLERAVLRRGDDVAPETLRTVQLHALDQAFWRMYGTDLIRADHLVAASQLARRAAELADCRGRVLAAAQQCLDWPTFPHLVLWQAASVLSEHRAAGRRAVLMADGLSPLDGHVLDVAAGVGDSESIRLGRAIMLPSWTTAEAGLVARGVLDSAGLLTAEGRELYASIDRRTDQLADQPLHVLGDDEAEELIGLVTPFSEAVLGADDFVSPRVLCLPEGGGRPGVAERTGRSQREMSTSSARPPRRPGPDRAQRFRDGRPRHLRRRPAPAR